MSELMRTLNPAVAKVLKRLHYPLDVILTCVRWYVAYPLSLRNLEEMMAERGIAIDHSTVHRWALKVLPVLEKALRRRKRPVGKSWRVDETYVKSKANGNTCIALSTRSVTPSIFCCEPIGARPRRVGILKNRSPGMANPRR